MVNTWLVYSEFVKQVLYANSGPKGNQNIIRHEAMLYAIDQGFMVKVMAISGLCNMFYSFMNWIIICELTVVDIPGLFS